MKVDNIKPEEIVSASPLVTVHKTVSKDLDEKSGEIALSYTLLTSSWSAGRLR